MNCSDAECVAGVCVTYRHVSPNPRLFAALVHLPSRAITAWDPELIVLA